MTNDDGRKQHDLSPSARTESSLQQSGSFMHELCVYYVCNKQITVLFFHSSIKYMFWMIHVSQLSQHHPGQLRVHCI